MILKRSWMRLKKPKKQKPKILLVSLYISIEIEYNDIITK